MNTNPSQTGTWNGWTEPAHQHNPMDDAAACTSCGFSPKIDRRPWNGLRYYVLECCGQATTPRLSLDEAVRQWNEDTAEAEAAYCERWAESMERKGDLEAAARWRAGAAEERRLAA